MEQSEISSDERAGAARPFQSPYRLEKSPANGGAEDIAARGGDVASIARMYIPRACRGDPPVPNAACGRKIGGVVARNVTCAG